MWWALAALVVSLAVSYAMSSKTASVANKNPSTLEDFDVPTAEDGKQMPVIFGVVTLQSSNIVGYFDLDTEEIREEASGGK